MVVFLILIMIVFCKWCIGVVVNLWIIVGMGLLVINREICVVFCFFFFDKRKGFSYDKLVNGFGDRMFRLGYFFNYYGILEYGVMVSRVNVIIVCLD